MNINCEYLYDERCCNSAAPSKLFRSKKCILLVPKEDIRLVEGSRIIKEKKLTYTMEK